MNIFRTAFLALPLLAALMSGGCERRAIASDESEVRIASLAPSLTEMLFAIGAGERVVGRTSFCTAPPEAQAVPVVAGFAQPYLEALLQVHPTQVVSTAMAEKATQEALERMGIAVELFPDSSPDAIPAAIRRLGALTDCTKTADRLAGDIEAGLAKRRREAHAAAPLKVFIVIWHAPLMTTGSGSYLDELVSLAGGENAGGSEASAYYRTTLEWLLRSDPDVLLFTGDGLPEEVLSEILEQAGWKELRAVKTGAVLVPSSPALVCQPGIHVLEGIEWLKGELDGIRKRTAQEGEE